MQPKTHIRYFPDEPSSVSALFYLEDGVDVYGWYAHAQNGSFSAAFFMLESFYVNRSGALYRSVEDDVYGPWINDAPPVDAEIRCPLPEPIRHELERIQSSFVDEWLFFETDPDASMELRSYDSHRLLTHAVNVKSRKLNRLDKSRHGWEHKMPGIDPNVMEFVEKNWRKSEKSAQQ